MLFAGDFYYPYGGMSDFKGSFDSKKDCLEYIKKNEDIESIYWAHIFDCTTNSVIELGCDNEWTINSVFELSYNNEWTIKEVLT